MNRKNDRFAPCFLNPSEDPMNRLWLIALALTLEGLAADETGLSLDTFPVESPFTSQENLDLDFLPQ